MTLRVVTSPGLLVSVDAAKVHLRVDHAEDDARITSLIGAATEALEAATQRRFMVQELAWVLPNWRYPMRLPVAPASEEGLVVTYADEILGDTALSAAGYVVRPIGATLGVCAAEGVIWPVLDPDAAERVVITFSAGEATAPTAAAEACKLLVEYYYEGRDWPLAASGLPVVVESLIAAFRWA